MMKPQGRMRRSRGRRPRHRQPQRWPRARACVLRWEGAGGVTRTHACKAPRPASRCAPACRDLEKTHTVPCNYRVGQMCAALARTNTKGFKRARWTGPLQAKLAAARRRAAFPIHARPRREPRHTHTHTAVQGAWKARQAQRMRSVRSAWALRSLRQSPAGAAAASSTARITIMHDARRSVERITKEVGGQDGCQFFKKHKQAEQPPLQAGQEDKKEATSSRGTALPTAR